jgi:hypothetical protein
MATRSLGSSGRIHEPAPAPPGVKDLGAGRVYGPPNPEPVEPTNPALTESEMGRALLHGLTGSEAIEAKARALRLEAERFGFPTDDIRPFLAERNAFVRLGLLQPEVQVEWVARPNHQLAGMSQDEYEGWSKVRNVEDAAAFMAEQNLRADAREEAKRQLAVEQAKSELSGP